MTAERRAEILEELEELARWANEDTPEISVYLEEDEYYFDLGQFGEHTTAVSLENSYYPYEAERFFEHAPISATSFRELIEALKDEEAVTDASLQDVLARMLVSTNEREATLAIALQAVIRLDEVAHKILAGVNVPAPWPGALQPDIDYTASDFPLRYQPPPGHAWAKPNSWKRVAPADATPVAAKDVPPGTSVLWLDDKGRVAWQNRVDGDYTNGVRWPLMHDAYNGFPSATGYFGDTPPRALDADGQVIPEPHTKDTEFAESGFNWHDDAERKKAAARIAELRAQKPEGAPTFQPPASVSL